MPSECQRDAKNQVISKEDLLGWRGSCVNETFIVQTEGAEFHSQHPLKNARSSNACL